MRNRKVLRAECDVILGDGGDNLVLGILEHRPNSASGGTIAIRMRSGTIEHHITQQSDTPRVRGRQSRNYPRQCGFARAVWTGQADTLPATDVEVHSVKRPCLTAIVGEPHIT